MTDLIRRLLTELFDLGFTEVVGDRDLAVAVFRAAQQGGRWEIGGAVSVDNFDDTAIYMITATPPLCDGGCGDRTGSATGMCYQCQCEAHAEGWYDMDTGYARV